MIVYLGVSGGILDSVITFDCSENFVSFRFRCTSISVYPESRELVFKVNESTVSDPSFMALIQRLRGRVRFNMSCLSLLTEFIILFDTYEFRSIDRDLGLIGIVIRENESEIVFSKYFDPFDIKFHPLDLKTDCLYYSGTYDPTGRQPKCAVNPAEPCEGCAHYESKAIHTH